MMNITTTKTKLIHKAKEGVKRMIRKGLNCRCGESDFEVTQDILTGSINLTCENCGLTHLIAVSHWLKTDLVNEERDFHNPSAKVKA